MKGRLARIFAAVLMGVMFLPSVAAYADQKGESFVALNGDSITVNAGSDIMPVEGGLVVENGLRGAQFSLPAGARLERTGRSVEVWEGRTLLFVAFAETGSVLVKDGNMRTTEDVALHASTILINSVQKVSVAKGMTYKVHPTLAGRLASLAAHAAFGWQDIKNMGVPKHIKYKHQYLCHVDLQVSRFKSTWNLDSWRPNVGYPATLAAGCNP